MAFSCDLCNKEFTAKPNLYRHKRTAHTTKRFVCDTCGKCFTQKNKLSVHKCISKSEEEPKKSQPIKQKFTENEPDSKKSCFDQFKEYGNITELYWTSIRSFSKTGSVQDIFNSYNYKDLFSLRNDFFKMFYIQSSHFKINFSFGFVSRN